MVELYVESMWMRPFCKEIQTDLRKSREMDDEHMLHSGNDRGRGSSDHHGWSAFVHTDDTVHQRAVWCV